jgi:hypothetical protein
MRLIFLSGLLKMVLVKETFKELIQNIQHLTMPEQEKYLAKFIEDWKGNMEQTDDVLVIGVRI